MSATTIPESKSTRHEYRRYAGPGHRSPCPALNTLANHGYISRKGRDLTFFEIVRAIVLVYNLSYPLSILLTFVGFITCGHVSFSKPPKEDGSQDHAVNLMHLFPRISLHLSSLSERNGFKIAHDASFVHPNGEPSESPDPRLVGELLKYASEVHDPDGRRGGGLGLVDIARYHAQRLKLSPAPLGSIHGQIVLGECALTWEVLRGNRYESERGLTPNTEKGGQYLVIPVSRLKQWFGDERLPDGWWGLGEGGVRPDKRIGLVRTRMLANVFGVLAGERSH